MKVLFTFGGIPHYLDALLNLMQQQGTEVVVVTPQKGNAIIGKGVKMVEGGSYRCLHTPEKKMFYRKAGYPELPAILEQEKPDIVVMGWPYMLQLAFSPTLRRTLRRLHIRLVIREIPFQTPPMGQIRRYFEQHPMYDEQMNLKSKGAMFWLRQWGTAQVRRYCYSLAHATLNYATVAYDILPSYGVKRDDIHVTFNATNTDALLRERAKVEAAEALLPPNPHRILHIGRLVRWKRVDLLIDALPAVLKEYPDAELVVVGNGPETEALKQQAERNHLEAHVRFVGAVYQPEVLGAYMHESAVYVLAGMGGLSINDAMTYGMPVICSVCDGTEKDLVCEGENGYYFREGDAASLAQKIGMLFASPERTAAMGRESERIIREKVNLRSVCDNYLQAFESIMQKPL